MATVTEAVTARSSTRGYTSEPLTEEEVTRILEAGLKAPTGNNKQEIHFTVLSGEHKLIQELEAEKNRMRNLTGVEHNFCYEAPTLIILKSLQDYCSDKTIVLVSHRKSTMCIADDVVTVHAS